MQGLPRRGAPPPPTIPRRGGPPQKRALPHVARVLAVASGKGGVGKSTVAVNLAFALAMHPRPGNARPRVGILDLDVFGPSIPKLMALESAPEPALTDAGALVPVVNHGLPCMSMGFLLPRPSADDPADEKPVVWRGLMVQKAVQQLLFDVDWRDPGSAAPLDVLVVDMPPGTGDVPLTLAQLVVVDGAVVVSTPQDVALTDVRKGVAMFRKVDVPITGLLLNESHFICPSCEDRHELFGSPAAFRATAARFGADVLGELPLVQGVSQVGDRGVPYMLSSEADGGGSPGGKQWKETMSQVASKVWDYLDRR
ncbi:P-loop containing nucleoside triphosphate hydrolase protein [Epithele typhae]|uniref:P-loop containing nucleoside triphosphate hydrolase protein n=1 Tax=Epithele typhae TaxID=378194 RepID=UPI002008A36E|nr:P-loop containing nucleoside triphosphate hydrolase protein [Epithele typhae]KAH9921941.1 P-loop containing nucleoside triphosphate hydrolase protein [Epithele typhae]